jgi:acyl dehydratase
MTGDAMAAEHEIYWEDFHVGEKVEIGSRVVTREEIIEFASKYDPQPFHVDEASARESMFGGLIASGWHTCALVMRMMCDSYLLKAASLGSPGIDNLKWLKPVRPGDRIRGVRSTLEVRASKSKPDIGVVKSLWEVFNQHDERVMTMEGYGMFRRRSPGN